MEKKFFVRNIGFFDINSNIRYPFYDGGYTVSQEVFEKQLSESVESGLVLDTERNVFVREGFGAFMGYIPDNCDTIEELVNFTLLDFDRKNVGKPTILEKVRELLQGHASSNFGPYFSYARYYESGYDLCIGPGAKVYGDHYDRAVYCRNYKEIIDVYKDEHTRELIPR